MLTSYKNAKVGWKRRRRHAPGPTGNDAGALGRDDGGCEGRARKPARRGPESGETGKGRREVGGERGHGGRREWGEEETLVRQGFGWILVLWLCHFAVTTCSHRTGGFRLGNTLYGSFFYQ